MLQSGTRVSVLVWSLMVLSGIGTSVHAEHADVSVKKALDPALVSYAPIAKLEGRLTITGSDTMQPLLSKVAAGFSQRYPKVKIAVEGQGSSAAIREFIIGYSEQLRGDKAKKGHDAANQARVLASSREMTPEELRTFKRRYGYEPMLMPVAKDAVAIYVNTENPIEKLTLEQVDAIFGRSRKRGFSEDLTTWGQIGLRDGWEQEAIHLYGRDKASGTREFFKHVALMDGELRSDIQEQPGSATEILAIARDPYGIGYAGTGYQGSFVRTVPLVATEGQPPVAPSSDTVADESYPLSRTLYLYLNQSPKSEFPPVMAEFLKFLNSREGQELVTQARFYPLPAAQAGQNLAILNGATVTASLLRR
jgi:phosphate transport system substrate-binding protein